MYEASITREDFLIKNNDMATCPACGTGVLVPVGIEWLGKNTKGGYQNHIFYACDFHEECGNKVTVSCNITGITMNRPAKEPHHSF